MESCGLTFKKCANVDDRAVSMYTGYASDRNINENSAAPWLSHMTTVTSGLIEGTNVRSE